MKVPHLIRILFPVAMISAAVAVPSQAQMLANALTNGDFEIQNPQLATNGHVNSGFSSLSGWADTTAQSGTEDSGVQGNGYANGSNVQKAQSGTFFVFERGGNPGAFQITGTQLKAGDQLTLTWYSLNSYLAPVQDVEILSAPTQGTAFSGALTLADANGSTNAAYSLGAVPTASPYYTMYTLTYTATAADVGRFVGVSTSNIGPANNYLQTDNYDLAITSVPEPGTRVSGMMVVGMAAGLIINHRRKQTLARNPSV